LHGLNACYGYLADLGFATSQFETAMQFSVQQLRICEEIGIDSGIGESLERQGKIFVRINQPENAISVWERAVQICREGNDPIGLQSLLGNLATLQIEKGDFPSAAELLREQGEICSSGQYDLGLAYWNANMANLYATAGHPTEAIGFLDEGIRLGTETKQEELVSNLVQFRRMIAEHYN